MSVIAFESIKKFTLYFVRISIYWTQLHHCIFRFLIVINISAAFMRNSVVGNKLVKLTMDRKILSSNISSESRAIARAVSRWLPTTAARVRAQVISCGIYGGQSGNGAGFLRIYRLPLQILNPPTAPYSSIIRGWYSRPNSCRRTPRNKKKCNLVRVLFSWYRSE
jgi:hypothetical protein